MGDKPFYGGEPLTGSDAVGGDRHYTGAGLGKLTSWKCPSCAVENTGPLDDGCPSCGAGTAKARHVGVPPPPRKLPIYQTPKDSVVELRAPSSEKAFQAWFDGIQKGYDGHTAPEYLLREAWDTAIAWYRNYLNLSAGVTDEPAPGEDPDIVAVPRELLREVLKQLEITIDLPDEAQSPELLALINRVRELAE